MKEIDLFLGLVPGNFSERMAAVEEEIGRINCVVSDGFWGFASNLAAERQALWISYWNSAPRALLAHLCTDLLRQSSGTDDDHARAQDALDTIPGLSSLRIEDLPEGIVLSDTTSSLALQLHHMSQVITSATAVVVNSFEGLDPTLDTELKTKFKRCLNIGPFGLLSSDQSNIDDKHGCLAWLDNQVAGSVVYISFGSSALPPKEELVEIAQGLQASGTPLLWSLQEIAWKHLPADFLDYVASRGLIVPWAPQPQVLEHLAVGTFLTHGGWNSILESITAGVPMMLRPFFGDQPLDARVVSDVWKIGMGFEGGHIKKDAMVNALNVTLRSERGKTMKEKVNELKSIALQAIKPGGSSTKNLDILENMVASCQHN
ncbi:putative UDP-glucuronosyl/UDP-glucosyltransferase [Dioscorea sansibarensis]